MTVATGRQQGTALQRLLRRQPMPPEELLQSVLELVLERLGADVAVLERQGVDGDVVRRSAAVDDVAPALLACPVPQALPPDGLLLDDVAEHVDLAELATAGARSVAAVPLRHGGDVVGALLAASARPKALLERDLRLLHELAEVAEPLVAAAARPSGPTATGTTIADLERVAEVVSAAADLEELTRPLLQLLNELTGLSSTYLTVVDEQEGVQHVRLAQNLREGFELPEGLDVPWGDTLCKRALDEGRPYTDDVASVWGDSDAARDLGIATYVSVPVSLSDGRLWGTLCGADSVRAPGVDAQLPTMRLFARLIATEVEREAALTAAREDAARATEQALVDELTGCRTRRAVQPWLDAAFAALSDDEVVLAAYVDVDAFKSVNDEHGHSAGDAVLAETGRLLREAARPDDLVVRLGGDEFLIAARLPVQAVAAFGRRLRERRRVTAGSTGAPVEATLSIGMAVASSGDAADLVAAADRAMYREKRR